DKCSSHQSGWPHLPYFPKQGDGSNRTNCGITTNVGWIDVCLDRCSAEIRRPIHRTSEGGRKGGGENIAAPL
ncbi:hypothetical protein T265_01538, partial [Opisthorchis viverrini]